MSTERSKKFSWLASFALDKGVSLRWRTGFRASLSSSSDIAKCWRYHVGVRGDSSLLPAVRRSVDSQDDSQHDGQLRTSTNEHGICELPIELKWTLTGGCGRKTRGLQNRLRGAVEASWVSCVASSG